MIEQLDGNLSLNSTVKSEMLNQIQVHWGYRPPKVNFERPYHSRKTIRRDNRSIEALALPKLANFNMRALFSKIQSLSEDMRERMTDVCFLTEVWEVKESKKHQFKIEEMFQMRGVKYISTPRPSTQRGGGAAIAVRTDKFLISKLNIPIPKSVEVVWGLLKPKIITGKVSVIIVCCFYSPPRSRKNPALLEHLTLTLQSLLVSHPHAGVIISGDRNSIDITRLLQIDSSLRQIVTQNTRNMKILDVILTNLYRYYHTPEIVPPICPDVPGRGAPSDHSGVIAVPYTISTQPHRASKERRHIRPIPESLLEVFGQKLDNADFTQVYTQPNPTAMVTEFEEMMSKMVEQTFPLKSILISGEDKAWFTEELRALKRRRLREYTRHGKSRKYSDLKARFDKKFEAEFKKYYAKIELEVTEGKRGSAYCALKKLGLRPGETTQPLFQLPNHVENNITLA